MGWVGKVLGGLIGYLLGGPLGAIVGLALGHGFDWSTRNLTNDFSRYFSPAEHSELTFFVAVFSMLSKLTELHARVSEEENRTIESFMRQDLGLDEERRETALRVMAGARDSPQGFDDFALQFYRGFHDNPDLLRLIVDILVRVAVSDGPLRPDEENLIHSAVSIFGLSEDEVQAILVRYSSAMDRFYAALECRPDDAPDEIKRQYRRLANEYHPDKAATRGRTDESTRYASERFREIQEAYERVRAERGF